MASGSALTLAGIFCRFCSRFVAVTMISSSAAAVSSCCANAAPGVAIAAETAAAIGLMVYGFCWLIPLPLD
jgi:hypothetical protein